MSNNVPDIKPSMVKQFESKQSKYDVVGQLPIRSIILGPSGSGKGILLQNMILDIYRGCFERVYIFSPSVDIDQTWKPVKKYLQDEMHIDLEKEKCLFTDYNPEELEQIIYQQHKVAEYQKKLKGNAKVYQILIIVDDFADDPSFSRNSKLLHSLFTRGRHSFISTIVSTQAFKAVSPIIRKMQLNYIYFVYAHMQT